MLAFLNGEQLTALCEGAVWVLVDAGVKGLALLALTLLASPLMRKKSAAARHLVWTLAMAGLLVLPFLSAFVPKWHLPILPRRGAEASPESSAPPRPASATPSSVNLAAQLHPHALPMTPSAPMEPPGEPVSSPRTEHIPVPSPEPKPIPWTALACAAWIVGAIAAILPLAIGILAARRLMRKAHPLDTPQTERLTRSPGATLKPFRWLGGVLRAHRTPPTRKLRVAPESGGSASWPALSAELHRKLRLKRPTPLLRSVASTMPMTWGLWRSVVLLPDDADSWPTEKRRAVLLHELAHVKRRDCLAHAVARLAFALHWFNPLAWIALRRLRVERERACDDLVLTAGSRPSDYAGHLLHIARSMRRPTLASAAAITMAKGSHLEGRISAILDKGRNRRSVTRWALALGVAAMAAVLMPLASLGVEEVDAGTGTSHKVQVVMWTVVVDAPVANRVLEHAQDVPAVCEAYEAHFLPAQHLAGELRRARKSGNLITLPTEMAWLEPNSRFMPHEKILNFPIVTMRDAVAEQIERETDVVLQPFYKFRQMRGAARVNLHGAFRASLTHSGVSLGAGDYSRAEASGRIACDASLNPGEAVVFAAPMGGAMDLAPWHIVILEAVDVPHSDSAFVADYNDATRWVSAGLEGALAEIREARRWQKADPARPSSEDRWTHVTPDGGRLRLIAIGQPSRWPYCWWDGDGQPIKGFPAWQRLGARMPLSIVVERDGIDGYVHWQLLSTSPERWPHAGGFGGSGGDMGGQGSPRELLGKFIGDENKERVEQILDQQNSLRLTATYGVGSWQEITAIREGETVRADGGKFFLESVTQQREKSRHWPGLVLVDGRYDFDPSYEVAIVAVDSNGERTSPARGSGFGTSSRTDRRWCHHIEMGADEIDHFLVLKRPRETYTFSGFRGAPLQHPASPSLGTDSEERFTHANETSAAGAVVATGAAQRLVREGESAMEGGAVSAPRTVRVPKWPRIPYKGGGFSGFGSFALRDWDNLRPLMPSEDRRPQEGKIIVPPGKALELCIDSYNNTDLSALDAFGPNDLQVLSLPLFNMVPESALPHIGRLTGLNMLFLGGSKTTDAGLEHLGSLDHLFHLDLNQCPVTDACVEPLKDLESLRSLVLFDTRVTNAGVKKLQAALPNCRIDWTPGDRLVWKGESSTDDGTMTVTRIGARLVKDEKWTFWKDLNWMLAVHVDNHANRPQNIGVQVQVRKQGFFSGSSYACKVFEVKPGFSGKVELPFRAVSSTARNKVKVLVGRTRENPMEGVSFNQPELLEALHEGTFLIPFPEPSEVPTLTIETHRYVRPGKDLHVRIEPGPSDWQRPPGETGNPQCRFRLDGKDYETGSIVHPLGPGWNSATFGGLLVGESGGARRDLKLPPGEHTLSMVFLDVPAAASDDPEAATVFPRIATNEVEFEVINEIPASYCQPVYEEGWEDLLRRKLREVVYGCVGHRSSPHIKLGFDGGLPFALAFDVAIQAEGPERWVKLGKIAVATNPGGITIDTDLGYKAPKPRVDIDTLTSRRWRLVFTPSEEAASRNPRIRRFYGREFVSDWMAIEPSRGPDPESPKEVPAPSFVMDGKEAAGTPVPPAILDRVRQNFGSIDDLKVVVDHPFYRKAEQRTFMIDNRRRLVAKRTYYERDAAAPPIPRELLRCRYTWAIKGDKEYWSETKGFAADEDPPEAATVVAFDGEVCRSKEPSRDYIAKEYDIEKRLRQYGSDRPMVGRAWGRRVNGRSLLEWLGDDSARLVGEDEVGGHACSIVEVPYRFDSDPDTQCRLRFFLGKDMNHALLKYESFTDGRFVLSVTNTRLAEVAPGCWLPMEGVLKSPEMGFGAPDAPRKPQTFVVVEAAANTDLDDSLFSLPLTPLERSRQEDDSNR